MLKQPLSAIFSAVLLICSYAYGNAVMAGSLPDFTELVEEVSPSIVNISTVQNTDVSNVRSPMQQLPEDVPEIFKHFFGDRFGEQFKRSPQPRMHPQSLGSGFIISKDGFILTNNHVVENADQIMVRLSDRSELEAKLIGADPRSDIALLKVDGKNLPAVDLGDSDKLKVGEWVLAIGSPFGFDYSVTAGIVSATGRSLANENYVPFIQTDVAINPGNSGGPLFNLEGEVVGINSQIYTRSGGFMGLSFAIPMSVAMDVVQQIKAKGYVARGWLGVYIQEVSKNLAESFGLDKPAGALITKVTAGSPAEKGGLKEGDIITKFNDEPVNKSSELPFLVGSVPPNEKVHLSIVRDSKKKSISLTLGELPSEKELTNAVPYEDEEVALNPFEIDVVEIEESRKEKWNLNGGVVVREVREGPAADAGLLVGDVITSIDGKAVDSVAAFEEISAELPKNKFVRMRIVRRGSSQYIPIKIED